MKTKHNFDMSQDNYYQLTQLNLNSWAHLQDLTEYLKNLYDIFYIILSLFHIHAKLGSIR